MKIVATLVTEIVKTLQKHIDPEITQALFFNYFAEIRYVNRWHCADNAQFLYAFA